MRSTRHFAALLFGAVIGFSCSGLLTSQSNAYPCDFSLAPELRDAPCVSGDVCSVNNVCVRFVYEGPRFEGPATLPDFTSKANAGAAMHPLLLKSAPESLTLGSPGAAVAASTGTTHQLVNSAGITSFDLGPGRLETMRAIGPKGEVTFAVVQEQMGPGSLKVKYPTGEGSVAGVANASVVRLMRDPGGLGPRLAVIAKLSGELIVTEPITPGDNNIATAFSIDPSQPSQRFIDVVPNLVANGFLSDRWPLLAIRADGLYAVGNPLKFDGGVQLLPLVPNTSGVPVPPDARIKLDVTGTLLSIVTLENIVSTWKVGNIGLDPTVTRAWEDCVVPGLQWFNPVQRGITSSVEVVRRGSSALVPAQVIGSGGSKILDDCTLEPLEAPFKLAAAARGGTVSLFDGGTARRELLTDGSEQPGVCIAGQHGELWRGSSITDALPLYLDRVPLDVSSIEVTVNGQAQELLTALTDQYLAGQEPSGPTSNGFRRLNLSKDGTRIAGLVHESRDWVVTSQGDMIELPETLFDLSVDAGSSADAGRPLLFGPRLLNGRNEPVEKPLWGEAIHITDGGLSIVVAADDSLYFVREAHGAANVSSEANQLPAEYPVLTPEPGVLIRHLAIERSALSTDGVTRVRGFVVTSRNAYQIELSGTPPRWKASPLVLQSGEPAEVWYDNPRGGLGRIGYRDGTIYTVPGGYQLVAPLPNTEGARAPRVIDYENLGGWPVAFTTTGVYAAWWDTLANGNLDNKFSDGRQKPMQWRAVTLPDGGTPWVPSGDVTPTGRLFVKEESYVCRSVDDGGIETCDRTKTQKLARDFRLFLFGEHQVLELGRHTRSNKTPPLEF